MSPAPAPAHLLVVIDGPAGAGKSTVARELAKRLGGHYFDTGSMYRAFTLRALDLEVDLQDVAALERTVDDGRLELIPGTPKARVLLDGEDVTDAIRRPEVTRAIHHLADRPEVRDRLVREQRRLAALRTTPLVAEGRDLASVVFPDADLKVYLDASVEERAQRRAQDLKDPPSPRELEREISERDQRDRSRPVGPLVRVDEAHYVDTTGLSVPEIVERLAHLAEGLLNR